MIATICGETLLFSWNAANDSHRANGRLSLSFFDKQPRIPNPRQAFCSSSASDKRLPLGRLLKRFRGYASSYRVQEPPYTWNCFSKREILDQSVPFVVAAAFGDENNGVDGPTDREALTKFENSGH